MRGKGERTTNALTWRSWRGGEEASRREVLPGEGRLGYEVCMYWGDMGDRSHHPLWRSVDDTRGTCGRGVVMKV